MDVDISEYESDVGLGEEDKQYAKSNNLEWFKGEKGRSYRVAPTYFHPLEATVIKAVRQKNPSASKEEIVSAIQKVLAKRAEDLGKSIDELAPHEKLDTSGLRFKRIEAHFKEGFGYAISRLGKDGPEADQVWKALGDVKTYFTTTLLVYPTNNDGEVNKDQLVNNWKVVPWRFSTKVYETLHRRRASLKENHIQIVTQDLLLKCTNGDYQNFDIDAAGPAIWLKSPAFKNQVLAKSHSLYDKLVPFREFSTNDLRIKLGLGGGGGSDDVGDEDFKGILDQV